MTTSSTPTTPRALRSAAGATAWNSRSTPRPPKSASRLRRRWTALRPTTRSCAATPIRTRCTDGQEDTAGHRQLSRPLQAVEADQEPPHAAQRLPAAQEDGALIHLPRSPSCALAAPSLRAPVAVESGAGDQVQDDPFRQVERGSDGRRALSSRPQLEDRLAIVPARRPHHQNSLPSAAATIPKASASRPIQAAIVSSLIIRTASATGRWRRAAQSRGSPAAIFPGAGRHLVDAASGSYALQPLKHVLEGALGGVVPLNRLGVAREAEVFEGVVQVGAEAGGVQLQDFAKP